MQKRSTRWVKTVTMPPMTMLRCSPARCALASTWTPSSSKHPSFAVRRASVPQVRPSTSPPSRRVPRRGPSDDGRTDNDANATTSLLASCCRRYATCAHVGASIAQADAVRAASFALSTRTCHVQAAQQNKNIISKISTTQ